MSLHPALYSGVVFLLDVEDKGATGQRAPAGEDWNWPHSGCTGPPTAIGPAPLGSEKSRQSHSDHRELVGEGSLTFILTGFRLI